MAVFRKSGTSKPDPEERVAQGFAQVGRGAQLRGHFQGRGILLVHGELSGVVDLQGDLIVGRDGRLNRIKARALRVRIEGQAEGRFRVDGPIEVARGAALSGEVEARQIQTSAGCSFTGTLRVAHPRRA